MSDLRETPEERRWVIELDLSHLTQQEIEHLHALRNVAQKNHLQQYLLKGELADE